MTMDYRSRSIAEQCILPPPSCEHPLHPLERVREGLRAATARALARQARAAFDHGDVALFAGAIGALVELAASPELGRRRS